MTANFILSNSLDKDNILGFNYPTRYGSWIFECPWDLTKWYHWFYRNWQTYDKSSKRIFHGLIILGFRKINIEWNCPATEAYFIYQQHHKNIEEFINKQILENKKTDNSENNKCCGGGCGCH